MLLQLFIVSIVLFIPTFVIGMAVLRAPSRAFVLAATFSIGATIGFFLGSAAHPLFPGRLGELDKIYVLTFASLAAIAGGVSAVWLLGRLSGHSLWRRE